MFCGVLCAITFNCLDLKPYRKMCKDFGHLPSSCPDKQAQQIIQEEAKKTRTSDEISPLKATESKRHRILKSAVSRQQQAPTPEQTRGVAHNDSGGQLSLSFTQVEDDIETDELNRDTCLLTDVSFSASAIFGDQQITSENPLKCAECDKVFAISPISLIAKRICDFPGHIICESEPGLPRLVCDTHPDCCRHEFKYV